MRVRSFLTATAINLKRLAAALVGLPRLLQLCLRYPILESLPSVTFPIPVRIPEGTVNLARPALAQTDRDE
jgi:hypothetical protein